MLVGSNIADAKQQWQYGRNADN